MNTSLFFAANESLVPPYKSVLPKRVSCDGD